MFFLNCDCYWDI